MKKLFILLAAFAVGSSLYAQETYENAKLMNGDLNGTAKYVGMGGAMDALGADITTMSTNPAGMGLFRHSMASLSFGFVSQNGGNTNAGGNKTNMSFDQAGFVYSKRTRSNSFLNIGFNYRKSKNFDYLLNAAGALNNASQNKLSYQKLRNGYLYEVNGAGNIDLKHPYVTCNQLDAVFTNSLFTAAGDGNYYYYPANEYLLDRTHEGYIGEYAFNISGNIKDRVYLGLTVGLHDVNYRHFGLYTEYFDANPENIQGLTVADDREISGTGVDMKFGIIVRPVETSPFRFGFSVATPTFYDLTTSNYTTISDGTTTIPTQEAYDFRLNTPWKFNFSLGHTIGKYVALGAGWEIADYSAADTRVNDGGFYNWYWDEYDESSYSDREMNRHTEQTLKCVHTLKLGMEVKPTDNLSLRAGYNYVSPMYKKSGYKDGTLESEGSYYSSATDYTNWESTNRFTCGIGYNIGKLSMDLAYQYSTTQGQLTPFMSYYDDVDPAENNVADAVKVKNDRHQLLFTLGYHF
ncbi:MAG: hemin receptor [Bacteroidaceae bacterium]|nr:hemin receptor [Bacteroidaceae bacterium]